MRRCLLGFSSQGLDARLAGEGRRPARKRASRRRRQRRARGQSAAGAPTRPVDFPGGLTRRALVVEVPPGHRPGEPHKRAKKPWPAPDASQLTAQGLVRRWKYPENQKVTESPKGVSCQISRSGVSPRKETYVTESLALMKMTVRRRLVPSARAKGFGDADAVIQPLK
jgi:hypothetical protein